MEEILASIRKIISDDAPPTPEANGAAAEVVDLTQVVEDDGSVFDIVANEQEPTPPLPLPPPPPIPEFMAEPLPIVTTEALVSDRAASVASSALSALANTVEIERLASSPMTGTAIGNGARTLEDMAIEILRPLLKKWLDDNLPATVDRLVQKEIERIARRS
jgi:cell pole-organizing protein PopZ